MKRRGADRVLGIDFDERYLAQARFAAERCGQDIEFRKLSVYDVGALGRALRPRDLHGRALPPAPSAARARPHPRARRRATCCCSSRCSAARKPCDTSPTTTTSSRPRLSRRPDYPKMHFIEQRYCARPTNWWVPNRAGSEAMLRAAGFAIADHPEEEVYICRRADGPGATGGLSARGEGGDERMIEAAMIWNEPNNKSHWDPSLDPDWSLFAAMATLAGQAIAPRIPPDPRARRHVADRPASSARSQGTARSTQSTRSRCTVSRSTGTCGRSTTGRQKIAEIRPSPTCPSGCRRSASPPSARRRCRPGVSRAPPNC